MELKGEYKIPAPREKVWAALNNPDVLEACIPGCDEFEMVSPTEFKAKVTTKIGPVKAKFKGAVTLSEINAPESYRISGQGEGGIAGHAKGGAKVSLAETDGVGHGSMEMCHIPTGKDVIPARSGSRIRGNHWALDPNILGKVGEIRFFADGHNDTVNV